jgi:hypothetical protein
MRFIAWLLFLLLPLGISFAGGKSEKPPLTLPVQEIPEIPAETSAGIPEGRRGETVMKAMESAYPERVEKIEYYNGDWTIVVHGERFYFSGGRLLPGSLLDDINDFTPLPFYNYQKELPPWRQPTAEESASIREQESLRGTTRLKRSSHFYDAIWRAHNRDEAWEHVKQIRFLGHPVMVHYSILANLSLVEEAILRESKTNTAVRQWITTLANVEGWSWRNIASSQSRSYHAYGAAIDLIPKSLRGLETYWLWTAQSKREWWAVPYSNRLHPPDEVIDAFESFGFIWGGKWRYYDTMHFEYRPEILLLSGIAMTDLKDLR